MKLYDKGVYLVNGLDIVEEGQGQIPISREEASENTIAYGILIWRSCRLNLTS